MENKIIEFYIPILKMFRNPSKRLYILYMKTEQ